MCEALLYRSFLWQWSMKLVAPTCDAFEYRPGCAVYIALSLILDANERYLVGLFPFVLESVFC